MKKTLRFSVAAPFLLDLANLTIVWFLQYERHFFIFGLFAVFHENCSEIQANTEAQKSIEN